MLDNIVGDIPIGRVPHRNRLKLNTIDPTVRQGAQDASCGRDAVGLTWPKVVLHVVERMDRVLWNPNRSKFRFECRQQSEVRRTQECRYIGVEAPAFSRRTRECAVHSTAE